MPDLLITERNTRRFTQTLTSKNNVQIQATRTFDVTGVADAAAGLVALSGTPFNIVFGTSTHPQDPRATVTAVDQTENVVAGMFSYTVTYSTSSGANDSLLLEPPLIETSISTYLAASDRDFYKVPVVNSAGFPIEGGIPMENINVQYKLTRWEQTYDIGLAMAYTGRINSNQINVPGGTLAPFQAKCGGILQGSRASNSPLIRVSYIFDCRKEGWKYHLTDQGSIGYGETPDDYSTADVPPVAPGEFVALASSGWSKMGTVRLDGTGKPINNRIKVQQGDQGYKYPVDPAAPENPSASIAAGYLDSALSTSDVKILKFRAYEEVAFNFNL